MDALCKIKEEIAMAFVINNNLEALAAYQTLRRNNGHLSKSLSRLSSGFRINSSADGPAALVISEKLRAQIVGLEQAVENSQKSVNMITTAEGSMIEMNSLLKSVRQLAIYAANTSVAGQGQLEAAQAQIDSAIRSIDRIANSTKYGNKYLLNGSQDYVLSNNTPGAESFLDVRRASLGLASQLTVNVDYITSGRAASANLVAGASPTPLTFAILGTKGADYVTVAGNASVVDISNAINMLSANTGVYASGGAIHSVEYGSKAFARLEAVSGAGWTPLDANGQDAVATINGINSVANGLSFTVDDADFSLDIALSAGTDIGAGVMQFSITGGGMLYQLGNRTKADEQASLGIKSMHSTQLGRSDVGWLNQLFTGGAADLFNNPEQAVRIIDAAINQVSTMRARLGAFQKNTLNTNINSLGTAIENITNSESIIRDTDVAEEMSEFTKYQVLIQAGTAILAQANVASQSVLQLLQ